MSARILTDRFKDTWNVNTGREAARVRRLVKADFDEARRDYDVTGCLKALERMKELSDTEGEISRRLGVAVSTHRRSAGLRPEPAAQSQPCRAAATDARKDRAA
jgi:hypothetical protein